MSGLSKYVLVSSLPVGIRDILSRVGYTRKDVRVTGADKGTLDTSCGDDGCRQFAAFVANGAVSCTQYSNDPPNVVREANGRLTYGGYGGHRATEQDKQIHDIPVSGAIVHGQTSGYGDRGPSASVLVHPTNPLLGDPALLAVAYDAQLEGRTEQASEIHAEISGSSGLTDYERAVLYAYGCLKSGPYRKEALAKVPSCETVVAGLITRGYLKRSANGATQITTAGKNTRRTTGGYDSW